MAGGKVEVHSIAELKLKILTEMDASMAAAKTLMQAHMEKELASFYSQGTPKVYDPNNGNQRTHQMEHTARTTDVDWSGNVFTFDAYLDQSGSYTSGSKPTMGQVLDLANYGIAFTTKNGYPARPTLGKGGFWERAEKYFQKDLDKAFSIYFRKK